MGIKGKITKNKKDLLAVLLIFLLALVFLKNCLGTETLMNNGHYLHEQTFFSYNYKSAMQSGTLPFWTPYWYSGQPLYGDSQVFFLNLTFLFILLFGNIFLAINLSTLIYFFISGLSMYLLVKYLVKSRSAAFISAIIYMFNGLIYGFVVAGNPSILEPYSLMPLIFLFVVKAQKSKNPVNYSILAGVLLAFQIFSGGAIILVYTLLLVGIYLTLSLISSKFKTNFAKAVIIGLILLLVLFGLSAVKLLPNYDFIKETNRAQGVSYQEYIGEDQFIFKDFFNIMLFKNPQTSSIRMHIGIVASLLALLSLGSYRKKMVIYLILISVFILCLASGETLDFHGKTLAKLFYDHVPAFAQMRHIGRVVFIFVFSISILAGYGYRYISEISARKFKISNKLKSAAFTAIVLLILTELVFAKGLPKGFNINDQLEQNELAKYLQQEKGKFRITTFDVDDLISFYGSSYYAHYGLETLSGGGGLWINDFIKYLAIAKNYDYSKLLGILNLKYAASTEETDVPGFKLVRKFEECIPCKEIEWTYWIAGPYLYENENFMPRYYLVNNSVLVIGQNDKSQDLVYSILLNKNFDPASTVIITGKNEKISDYDVEFLKIFNAIILAQESVDSDSLSLLEKYKDSGGRILPDILNDKKTVTISEMDSLLGSFNGNFVEAKSEYISPNEIELTLENKGFLVLSEKFSLFEEWSAEKGNKNLDILSANVIISSVYVDSPGTITFKFTQKSFKKGLIISLVTLSIIFLYGLFFLKRKWTKVK
ncbi:YfhO family protein [Candidatus Woesearchaeota archaeon]|nr:YfhO family protein [Candidatus Woesearchaeota archaeon]